MIKDRKIYENGELDAGFVRGVIVFLAAVMLFLVFVNSVFVRGSNLNCSIMPSGDCAETAILYLQNETGGYWNAHAENVSSVTYNYVICCDANDIGDTITTNCDDATLLKLSAVSNAHVQQPSVGTYGVDACISATTGSMSCTYPTTGCSPGQACLASMASSEGDDTTNAHISNCSHYSTDICCGLGTFPSNPSPILNSSDPTLNRTAQNLWCSFVPDDIDGGTLYANITWLNNSIKVTTNSSISVTNGTQFVDIINSDYTTKHDNWTCSVQICDSINLCSNWVNSSILNILNTPPAAPTLLTPQDGNITEDRSPTFTWSAPSDADGDSFTYNHFTECNPACSADNKKSTGIAGTTHTITGDLDYFWDDGDYYEWYVGAYDGEDYGANASNWNFSIQSQVVLSLLNSSINFGTKNIGETDDTTDDTPSPFSVQNDGNCHMDMNISADDLLWDTQPTPSSYFQYKVDNYTGKEGAFNWSSSTTTWTNIPVTNTTFVSWFNYSDATDSAEIDIRIDVPLDEPAWDKNAMIQFTGHYVKIT